MKELLSVFGGVDKFVKFILYVIAAIAIYYTIKKIIQTIKQRNAGKQVVDLSQLDAGKNYDSYALAVHTAFDNFWNDADEMNDTAGTLLPLNNDELKQVNNRYLTLYGEGETTLYQALGNYNICYPCSNIGAIRTRLKSIGIL